MKSSIFFTFLRIFWIEDWTNNITKKKVLSRRNNACPIYEKGVKFRGLGPTKKIRTYQAVVYRPN